MPLELTEQQRQALADRPLGPVELIDPATQRAYVLIAADQFQRVADFLARPPVSHLERERERSTALDQFLALARSSSFRSEGPYPARDELHERD